MKMDAFDKLESASCLFLSKDTADSNEIEQEKLLSRLLKPYRRYFDIYENEELFGKNIPAMAAFHSRNEKYVLTKKAKLWGAECHEYVFFFQTDFLTVKYFEEIADLLKKAEIKFVKPHDEHMYTHLTAVISSEKVEQEAEKMLCAFKSRKKLSFIASRLVR